MPGVAEIAAAMMIGAERRIDVAAANVSNLNTPGYRSRKIFAETLDRQTGLPAIREAHTRAQAKMALKETGSPYDLVTGSEALLALRSPKGIEYSRTAQLHRTPDGQLVDGQGRILQAVDSGDLTVSAGTPAILLDGTIVIDGQPQARIGLFGSGSVEAGRPELAEAGTVRQGMIGSSDVELGDEMLELNKASRMAEAGAKLFQICDDLLAKTASQLGSIAK